MKRRHFIGKEARLPETKCLDCGAMLDAATGVDNIDKPSPGCITICIRCGHLMAFADDLSMRSLTDEEMKEVAGDESILAIQWARGKVMKGE